MTPSPIRTLWANWPTLRGMASWVVGAYWGNIVVHDPGPTDWGNVLLVAGAMALPFAERFDTRRHLAQILPELVASSSANGNGDSSSPGDQAEHSER